MKMLCADAGFLSSGWVFINLSGIKSTDDWFLLVIAFLFIFILSFVFGIGSMALYESAVKIKSKWNGRKMQSKQEY